jgi:radical SAM protein with 4Fe4S-binding SPASM domain
MLVKQSKNTFIRTTERYGYITNQLTRHDRSYSETGADYLKYISREPQNVEDIIDRLMRVFANVDREMLREDFVSFIADLAEDHFLIIGKTIQELDANDQSFTYEVDNPKTVAVDFSQETKVEVSKNTQDFFLEEVQGRPLISSLQFELSSRCNERCIHCYIPNGKKNKGFDMPLNKVKSILDEYSSMGGLHVTLSGGEAFLHKDLLEICRYCREKDLRISILSNLISLKEEQIPILKEVNLSLIQTSLYSMDPKIHDFITTVPGSHAKTKAAIELLVKNDIPVQISCPIMKANRKGYADVLEYAKGLKIKAQTDYIMMAQADFDTNNLANRISIEETEELLRDIIEHDIDYKKMVEEKPPVSDFIAFDLERYKKQPVCGVGYDNCCITANGDVYPCAGWQNYVLGNVYKQPLKEIWEQSPRVKELRKITQASFPQCLECEARDYCARCLVRNYNESGGDMFKINEHFCKVAFLNKRLIEEYRSKGLLK